MKRVIVIPDGIDIDFDNNLAIFIYNLQNKYSFDSPYGEKRTAYEMSTQEFENAVNNGLGSDRKIRFVDIENYCRDLLNDADKLLEKQPDGTKVDINATDTIASIIKTDGGYNYTIGKKFDYFEGLLPIEALLNNFIIRNNVQLLDIRLKLTKPADGLFDIYTYAAKTEEAMLAQLFEKHAIKGRMTLPENEDDTGFALTMLAGMNFETAYIKSISRKNNFFYFDGVTENGDKVSLTMDEMPPKGIAYLIEYLYQQNY